MSFSSNNYYQSSTAGSSSQRVIGGVRHQQSSEVSWTTPIGAIAAGTPTVMKHSRGTRFEDCSSVTKWTVKGLQLSFEGTTSIESLPFPHQNSSEWCMILTNDSGGLHLGFMLIKSGTEMPLRAKLRAEEILPTGEKQEVFPCKWHNLKQREKMNTVLIRRAGANEDGENADEITLQCEIVMRCIIQDELPPASTVEPQDSVVKGLYEMLHREVLTDFELRTAGAVLKAHRALLSVRSPYFAAMLQPHTKESQEGFVQVTDVSPEVLKQVLQYVYTGEAPALEDMPWDLLIAADKYQLLQLRRRCEAHLASCLTVDNAAETAANALLFSYDILWDRAVVFIRHNLHHVMCRRYSASAS